MSKGRRKDCYRRSATTIKPDETQKCPRCDKIKPIIEFVRRGKVYTGCNVCRARENKQRRQNKYQTSEGLMLFNDHLGEKCCGVCGEKITDEGVMLCNNHRPRFRAFEGNYCNTCDQFVICKLRTQVGMWVICEIPDKADIRRISEKELEPKLYEPIGGVPNENSYYNFNNYGVAD